MNILALLGSFLTGRSRFFYFFVTLAVSSILVLTGFLSFSYLQLQTMYASMSQTAYVQTIEQQLTLLVEKLSEAEGKTRGYALTKNKEFIADYPQLVGQVLRTSRELEKLSPRTPYPRQLNRLGQLVQIRLYLLDQAIAYMQGNHQYESDNAKLAALEQSRRLMNQIRAIRQRLQQQNQQLLAAQDSQARHTLSHALWLIVLAVMILFVLVFQIGLLVYKYVDKHRQAQTHLRELNEQKSRFFSIVSHDLRGPVHAAHMLLGMMDDQYEDLSDADRKLMRQTTLDTLGQTARLLESLLAWSKTQMNQLHFSPRRTNLYELAMQVLEYSRPLASQKQIRLACAIDETEFIQVDVAMFEVVLRNLVSNAIKFTLPGGQVRLAAEYTAGGVRITVTDTGIGMSEQVRSQLFQVDSKHTTEGTGGEKGSGLGLVLTRQFVEKHGGHIRVHSRLGEGSVFEIQLPETVHA